MTLFPGGVSSLQPLPYLQRRRLAGRRIRRRRYAAVSLSGRRPIGLSATRRDAPTGCQQQRLAGAPRDRS